MVDVEVHARHVERPEDALGGEPARGKWLSLVPGVRRTKLSGEERGLLVRFARPSTLVNHVS
jgi:hypothetical protein